MRYTVLGKAGFEVSSLSLGASALGGVFGEVDEARCIETVHTALDHGINYIDVSPAYGATRAEVMLGRALRGVDRARYRLSTKVGKTMPGGPMKPSVFDFRREAILRSLDESRARIGVEYFDIIHLHDIEYEGGRHIDIALGEGLETLLELKAAGAIGAVSVGTYPIDLCRRIIENYPVDTILVHNHYQLKDTLLEDLIPVAAERNVGLINASPFAMGLLGDREPPAWHPANADERALFARARDFCRERGTSLSKLALQFATQHPGIPTTLFSTSRPEAVLQNIAWHEEPCPRDLVAEVQAILAPVLNRDWDFANTVG